MRTRFLFSQPAFGPRLGQPLSLRLGQVCTDAGTYVYQPSPEHRLIRCPVGPDCNDLVDAVDNKAVATNIKGAVPWMDECSRAGYTNPNPGAEPTSTTQPTVVPSQAPASIPTSNQGTGTGPIPTQPLMQPQPAPSPTPKAGALLPAPVNLIEKKTLDTGSAVGIGAVLIAVAATAFFAGK